MRTEFHSNTCKHVWYMDQVFGLLSRGRCRAPLPRPNTSLCGILMAADSNVCANFQEFLSMLRPQKSPGWRKKNKNNNNKYSCKQRWRAKARRHRHPGGYRATVDGGQWAFKTVKHKRTMSISNHNHCSGWCSYDHKPQQPHPWDRFNWDDFHVIECRKSI